MSAPTGGWQSGPHAWEPIESVPLVDGISARTQSGTEMSVTMFALDPGAVVPEHAHPNEEFGHVIAGAIRLWCDGREWVANAGDSFFVATGMRHRALALDDGCQLMECYAPPRVPTSPNHPRTS